MWGASKYVAALAISLPLWGIPSDASFETHTSAATEQQSDLNNLLWPVGTTAQRIDQRGVTFSPAALRDKVVAVSFVTPDCSITCVTRTIDLDRVAKALPETVRKGAVFLTISLDNASGGAGRLRAFVDDTVGADTRLRVLAGDSTWTAAVTAMLRYPKASLPEPPGQIMLFDRRGAVATNYGGDPVDRPRLEGDITLLQTFIQVSTHHRHPPTPCARPDPRP